MQSLVGLLALALVLPSLGSVVSGAVEDEGHHHGHHHKHHKHKKGPKTVTKDSKMPVVTTKPNTVRPVVLKAAVQASSAVHAQSSIVDKMKALEAKLAAKAKQRAKVGARGHLLVNGPLPADFNERFSQAVGHATGADANSVHVTDSTAVEEGSNIVEVAFEAPPLVVKKVETDAADPESKLAQGNMHSFLVAKSDNGGEKAEEQAEEKAIVEAKMVKTVKRAKVAKAAPSDDEVTPVQEKGIDIDTAMPYGDLEPFGREDTAQELTESSVKESDEMVDQLERAEVAEEKRSVFRALTRLRGAAITSFDGVARSQTGNIDEYNKVHKWRKTHPLHHLADEESDVTKWAFPDNADF